MQLFVDKSRELLSFDIDPLGLLAHFGTLKEYVKKPNSTMRLAMNNPTLYKKLLPLIRVYEKFTQIERKARKKLKAIFKGKNRI